MAISDSQRITSNQNPLVADMESVSKQAEKILHTGEWKEIASLEVKLKNLHSRDQEVTLEPDKSSFREQLFQLDTQLRQAVTQSIFNH